MYQGHSSHIDLTSPAAPTDSPRPKKRVKAQDHGGVGGLADFAGDSTVSDSQPSVVNLDTPEPDVPEPRQRRGQALRSHDLEEDQPPFSLWGEMASDRSAGGSGAAAASHSDSRGSGGLWMQRRGSTRPFFSNGVPTELEPFYLQNLQQQSPAQQPGGGDEANFLRQTDDGMLQAPGRFSYHHDSAAADCVRSHAAVQRRMVGRDPTREEEAVAGGAATRHFRPWQQGGWGSPGCGGAQLRRRRGRRLPQHIQPPAPQLQADRAGAAGRGVAAAHAPRGPPGARQPRHLWAPQPLLRRRPPGSRRHRCLAGLR